MKLSQFLLLSLCITIFACSSDSDNNPNENENQNNNNTVLLKKSIETDIDGDVYTTSYEYNGNKLTSVNRDDEFITTFLYSDDKIIRINNTVDGELMEYFTLEYDANDKLKSYKQFLFDIADLGDIAYEHILTFNTNNSINLAVFSGDFNSQTEFRNNLILNLDDNGNIIKETIDDSDDTLDLEFDDKNGVFKNISQISTINIVTTGSEYSPDFFGNTNNVTKRNDNQGNSFFVFIETFDYIYNDKDYPVSAKYNSDNNGTKDESTIEYIY
ncbi:hypothetical protein [uncultured Algibacter sp.]|uniref:hypothetical protein n=1 Tax=uncultured Algibacter sp. TaxID=298659 RepID=UPI003217FAB6